MSFTNNKETELFTQLSEAQEENISGGVSFGLSGTFFSAEESIFQTTSASGPAGSVTAGAAVQREITTGGLNIISLDD